VMNQRSDNQELLAALIETDTITAEAAKRAAQLCADSGKGIIETLLEMGEVVEEQALQLLELQFQVPFTVLSPGSVERSAASLIAREAAERLGLVAIARQGAELVVAMADPLDVMATDEVQRLTGLRVRRVLARKAEIMQVIAAVYGADGSLENMAEQAGSRFSDTPAVRLKDKAAQNDEDAAHDAPIVKLVNELMARALEARGSDIHIEPGAVDGIIRCRVDGVLTDMLPLSMKAYPALISRLKIMGGMDISERRIPQDGRFTMRLDQRPVDFRVSSLPTVLGEKMVLRLLDKGKAQVSLGQLGLTPREAAGVEEAVTSPHGLFIVTGPTGSGKTTTLYSVLQRVQSPGINIVTCEDPVEYQLDRINQVQLNTRAGLTFGAFLRSVLRQDPDVIMVGEIRDAETVELALRAALTGHLVLATLHTNDAVGVATRLIDMGAEPFLLASTLTGALAQRLLRTVCQNCRERHTPEPGSPEAGLLASESADPFVPVRGAGCRACGNTGYRGRVAVFELFRPNEETRRLIVKGADGDELRRVAQAAGMTPLREAAMLRARHGETTLEEVLRVTRG
ncbi:MAG: GspE/PulE family protein, partial [Armatimonadota bacterium]